MPLTPIQAYFLQALSAAVRQEPLTLTLSESEWTALFELAGQQAVLPLLYEQAAQTEAAGQYPQLFDTYKQRVIAQVASQLVRSMDFRKLYRRLRERGLHPMVLKGRLCDRLYPVPCRRVTSDDDLLIPPEELEACHRALLELGLHTDAPPDKLCQAYEVSYYNDTLYIELHLRLFGEGMDDAASLNAFFRDVHQRAAELDGFLTLPPQEHLLFLLLHAYKHFIYSGVGLRQAADIGLWARAYADQIDWAQLRQQCREVNAEVFAAALFRILREQLGLSIPGAWESEEDTEPLLKDMLTGGVFGAESLSRMHTATLTLNAIQASRSGQHAALWRSIFPPAEYLQGRFRWLVRYPWLLPAAWIGRIFHYLGEILCQPHSRPGESLRLARERIALLRYYRVME